MVASLMLRASSDVLAQARDELSRKGYAPLQLSRELGLAVQLIENFLNGEIVDRNTYELLCDKLNIHLNFGQEKLPDSIESDELSILNNNQSLSRSNEAVTTHDAPSISTPKGAGISKNENGNQNLVKNSLVNSQINIDECLKSIRQIITPNLINQCDRLRLVDINAPLNLHDLYTEINIFTDLASTRHIDLNEEFDSVAPEQYDRFYLAKLQPPTVSANQALDQHKLILLVGGLGAGKTTLLKYWAMACITGKVLPNYVPIFLSVRSLLAQSIPMRSLVASGDISGENYLMNWLKAQIYNYGLPQGFLDGLPDNRLLDQLLKEGRFLLLWDGLDDIPEHDRTEVAQQIMGFIDRYPKNRMVVTSRNPIYGHILEAFQTLEIAPWQESQINAFASKWFQVTCADKPKKNEQLQQLLATNPPIAEIARNPLFLTYLCIILNSYNYLKPNFYQEILNLLLNDWEQTKCLPINKFSQSHPELSVLQKQDLLSYMAIVALDRHGYVWQNNQLEDDFQDCIATSRSLAHLEVNRDRFLKSLKWQHSILIEPAKGIYCLAHNTLHDYLAAYRIANSNPEAAEKYLLERIYLKRWHGVIVMAVSISQQADQMLQKMKQKIDQLVLGDPHLQSFLAWVNQQSDQTKTPYKSATIRALYLDIDLENTRSLDRARALDIAHSRSLERARTKAMGLDNTMDTEIDIDYTINLALNLGLALYFASHPIVELACAIEPDLRKGLQYLRQKFPDHHKDREKFAKWWQAKGLEWSKKLRSLIVHHRKGSQDWEFSENQLKILRAYHDANKLLIECLNNAEYVSPLVKNQIESNLLLPRSDYSSLQY
jgi:predicted NACHT family NTPase